MEQEDGKNGPAGKLKIGRFEISIWRKGAGLVRACIQHSKLNRYTGEWINQSIWCNAEELRDLANILDGLDETEQETPRIA